MTRTSSVPSTDFNAELMNLIITENRLQNTELRLAMMKMNEKVDKLVESKKKSL